MNKETANIVELNFIIDVIYFVSTIQKIMVPKLQVYDRYL